MIRIQGKTATDIKIGTKTVITVKDHFADKYLYWIPAAPTATFNGVRIMRYNGEIISLPHWQADNIPVSEAVGVAIGDGDSSTGHRFALFKYFMNNTPTECQFTPTNTYLIPNMVTTTAYATAIADFDGKANTQAVLDAISGGYITKSNVATYCNARYSPWGERAYIPSAGQMKLLFDNASFVNDIMTYIGGDLFDTSGSSIYWTSTQYNTSNVWTKENGSVGFNRNKVQSSSNFHCLIIYDY